MTTDCCVHYNHEDLICFNLSDVYLMCFLSYSPSYKFTATTLLNKANFDGQQIMSKIATSSPHLTLSLFLYTVTKFCVYTFWPRQLATVQSIIRAITFLWRFITSTVPWLCHHHRSQQHGGSSMETLKGQAPHPGFRTDLFCHNEATCSTRGIINSTTSFIWSYF